MFSATATIPPPSDLQNISPSSRNSAATQNALDFVRALKAPADPPFSSGPSKVQTAKAAWDNNSFYMPNKAETIVEWLLTRLLKDKAKDPAANPLLDIQYWSLLEQVLFAQSNVQIRDKAWLIPLLNRIPLAPIVVSFVSLSSRHRDGTLEAKACRCLSALWPLAVSKFSSEALLECFGVLSGYLAACDAIEYATNASFVTLGSLIVSSHRASLVNTPNRKKSYLQPWLQCTADHPEDPNIHNYYQAGIETLFNVDTLRTFQDAHAANTLETALANIASTRPEIVLQSLPRLFRSYGQAQTKHRSALYGQGSKLGTGSTTDQARSATMGFFALCESLLSQIPEGEESWTARVSLLHVVDHEGLLSRSDESSAGILRQIGETAITALTIAKQDNKELIEAVLTTLATLTRIDYDLVPFGLSRILPILIKVPATSRAASDYLQQTVDYHAKTRTVDAYITATFQAITALQSTNDMQELYRASSSAPLFHHEYLHLLSRSVRSYLTPGQIFETAQGISRQLLALVEEWNASVNPDSSDRPKKKRKVDNANQASVLPAVKFALVVKAATPVLTSLPLHSLLSDAQEEVCGVIQAAMGTLVTNLKAALKKVEKEGSWGWQLFATAILRLRYALSSVSALKLSSDVGDKLLSKMLACLKGNNVTSELRVEILRSLLYEVNRGRFEAAPVFDEVLSTIGDDEALHKSEWSGGLHELSNGTANQAGVAVLHLLCTRWLPLLNELASDAQISRFAACLVSGRLTSQKQISSDPTITSAIELQQVLQNAEFWELSRLRDALLSQILEQTAVLDNAEADHLGEKKAPAQERLPLDIQALRASFEIILFTPQECLSRENRNGLLRRAFVVDAHLASDADSSPDDGLTLLIFVREFIRRSLTSGTGEHQVALPYLSRLMASLPHIEHEQLTSLTEDLIRIHISAIVASSARQSSGQELQEFLQNCTVSFKDGSATDHALAVSLNALIDTLTSEYKVSQFSDSVLQSLRHVQDELFAHLLPQCTLQRGAAPVESTFLGLWWRILSLRRWLGTDNSQTPFIAMTVASSLLSSGQMKDDSAESCSSILAIALGELHLNISARDRHLEFIVASYIQFSQHLQSKSSLDATVARASRNLQVPDFDGILDAVVEGLGDETLGSGVLSSLIQLFGIMLLNSPEGTLKIVQKHTSQCLVVFANRAIFVNDADLNLKAFEFIAKHFNERPAAIRSFDVATTWSFLGHGLAGSSMHIVKTSTATYQEVISIISVLVRLRRDLVLSTLPLLGTTLHKLILMLRTLTPNLGATQSKMVSDTLPRWVNATDPMTSEESKALARLLTTLNTKTLIRTHSSANAELQKADSLARPFSKHAAHVLSAYLAALNDPLCVMSSAIRKELEPGLFALCEVMGEQNRDALMVTLNAGEKAVMKGLWRTYEKQRYVGKG
ncbi:hypothetical protein EIP91_005031 [Steccherinum ochraceum]|uniref:Nucleolar 27S pre-rRNA processing Urb2/Npa2 C-terminal domain-containing protein n=1 Tax=Steccherinum ochraceum TaxID=92696 RepID=A0A4R0RMP8_9APHY|nr:hypothetical protein EIP91_005031 [Steccherinum ochraceum]